MDISIQSTLKTIYHIHIELDKDEFDKAYDELRELGYTSTASITYHLFQQMKEQY